MHENSQQVACTSAFSSSSHWLNQEKRLELTHKMNILQVYIVRAFDCQDQKDDVPVSEVGSDAEEKPKWETKNTKKNGTHQLKNSTKFDREMSSQVSATRRSLRKK